MTDSGITSLQLRLQEARTHAIVLHGDQKYGERPYVYHLDQVAALARRFGLSDDEQVASYLHDTYEDTDITEAEMTARYGVNVHLLVYSVSGEGATREEMCDSIVAKLTAFPRGINLKLVDRLANVSASLSEGKLSLAKRYRAEMPKYDPLFRQGHPGAYAELCRLFEAMPS